MIDEWVHGTLTSCQDHCPKFVEHRRLTTPGGAAGAARQLARWNAAAYLIGPYMAYPDDGWNQVNFGFAYLSRRSPCKRRFIDENGRILWRHDLDNGYGFDAQGLAEIRKGVLNGLRSHPQYKFDAILISDYDKGFLDADTIRKVIEIGNEQGIPVVSDAKRHPRIYHDSILKGNDDYKEKHGDYSALNFKGAIFTGGNRVPAVGDYGLSPTHTIRSWTNDVKCINHVGAGDAFAAHLTLSLAHGLSLEDAATIAHSAGRVYVQNLHGRPPWPHEIKKDLDPVGGKTLERELAGALRRSCSGRIVFSNGCFRIPHAGHAWGLRWAKQQGDVLVVGVNSDESVQRVKPMEPYLPLSERLQILSSFECVDWIIPFEEDEPCAIIGALQPDILVKGKEYEGQEVPGCNLVKEVRFAPDSPFENHCSDLVTAIRGG